MDKRNEDYAESVLDNNGVSIFFPSFTRQLSFLGKSVLRVNAICEEKV